MRLFSVAFCAGLIAASLATTPCADATTVKHFDLGGMTASAARVFRGTVTDVRAGSVSVGGGQLAGGTAPQERLGRLPLGDGHRVRAPGRRPERGLERAADVGEVGQDAEELGIRDLLHADEATMRPDSSDTRCMAMVVEPISQAMP